jgi:hypothetical protein
MQHAWFDLRGTILRHDRPQVVPLMPELIAAMQDQDWNVSVVTRFSLADAKARLRNAGVDLKVPIFSVADRAADAAALARTLPENETVTVIDNKPENLLALRDVGHPRVRPLGFVGSHQYGRNLAKVCAKNGIELALSSPDLSETLQVDLSMWEDDFSDNPQGLADMIPGLDHPFSSLAGETGCFDHRRPIRDLIRTCPNWWDFIWDRLGWITCNECLWKALVELSIARVGLERDKVLHKAYKADEYTKALQQCDAAVKSTLVNELGSALRRVEAGLSVIGPEAEQCRPKGRSIEPDRIQLAYRRIEAVAGE